MSEAISNEAPYETKAKYLRRLFRQGGGDLGQLELKAEYRRLFHGERDKFEFAQILTNAWIEARQLAGWVYDMQTQAWFRADGSRVLYDDGSEWRHL